MFSQDLVDRAQHFLRHAEEQKVRVACAESCTGGLLGALLTHSPGASAVLEASLVTYSNEAKRALLGVDRRLLETYGAVSQPVADAMAQGALERSPEACLAVSITGVAGPEGGSPDKPVGLVHFACAVRGGEVVGREARYGAAGRLNVRLKSVEEALSLLSDGLGRLRR